MISKEEFAVQMSLGPGRMSKTDILDILAPDLTLEDRTNLVKFQIDQGVMTSPGAWDVFLAGLTEVEDVANILIPIESAVQGAISLGQTIKAL